MTVSRLLVITVLASLVLVHGCAHKKVTGGRAVEPAATEPSSDDDSRAEQAPASPPPSTTDPAEALTLGLEVATLAREQVGRPYRWGGENPSYGFDCSGLVQWTYGSVGVDMPRVVREQQKVGRRIDGDRLRPGDLVFFAIDGRSTSHVGVFIGHQEFVHAPRAGQPVRVDSLDDRWWRERWTDSRRVLGS